MCKHQGEHMLTTVSGSLGLLLDINDKEEMNTMLLVSTCREYVNRLHLISTGDEHSEYAITLSELTRGVCVRAF